MRKTISSVNKEKPLKEATKKDAPKKEKPSKKEKEKVVKEKVAKEKKGFKLPFFSKNKEEEEDVNVDSDFVPIDETLEEEEIPLDKNEAEVKFAETVVDNKEKVMEQVVLIYDNSFYFKSIIETVKEFEGLKVFGINDPDKIFDYYKTKLTTRNIYLFIKSEEELAKMESLFTALKDISTVTVYIILDADTLNKESVTKIKPLPKNTKLLYKISFEELVSDVDNIRALFTSIINQQPVFKEEPVELEKPKQAEIRKTSLIPKLSAMMIDKKIKEIKEKDKDKEELIAQIIAQDLQEITVLDASKVKELIPTVAYLAELKKEVKGVLEDNISKGMTEEDLDEFVEGFIRVSVKEKAELSNTLNTLVEQTRKAIAEQDIICRGITSIGVEELRELEDNIDAMTQKRAELKDNAYSKLKVYKDSISLAVNTIKYLMDYNLETTKELKYLTDELEVNPTSLQVIENITKKVYEENNQLKQQANMITKTFKDSLTFVNSMLKDFDMIITLDEYIFAYKDKQIEILSSNKIVNVIKVDENYKTKAVVIKSTIDSGATSIMQNVAIKGRDLIIDLRTDKDRNLEYTSLNSLLSTTLTQNSIINTNLIVDEKGIIDEICSFSDMNKHEKVNTPEISQLFNLLKTFSDYKENIFILINNNNNDGIFELFEDIPKQAIITKPDNEAVQNIKKMDCSKTQGIQHLLIINKSVNNEDTRNFIKLTGLSPKEYTVLLIPVAKDFENLQNIKLFTELRKKFR